MSFLILSTWRYVRILSGACLKSVALRSARKYIIKKYSFYMTRMAKDRTENVHVNKLDMHLNCYYKATLQQKRRALRPFTFFNLDIKSADLSVLSLYAIRVFELQSRSREQWSCNNIKHGTHNKNLKSILTASNKILQNYFLSLSIYCLKYF